MKASQDKEPAAGMDQRLTQADLQAILGARDPAARLALPRILRRVIVQHRQLSPWSLAVPHRKSYVIDREALLEFVDKEEIGLESDEPMPARMILLESPDADWLAATPASEALLYYWRLLFHAQVHVAMEQRIANGHLSPAAIRRRIHQIGATAFDEIRTVLRQEDFLLPPEDDLAAYVEFASLYLEFRYFAPSILDRYFPTAESLATMDAVLAQDVDATDLLFRCRLPGAADPQDASAPELEEWPAAEDEPEEPLPEPPEDVPSRRAFRRLIDRAQRAMAVGNAVRAAILRSRAERVAPDALVPRARALVREALNSLVRRLQKALDLPPAKPLWKEALAALIEQASRGFWNAEGRLLYDLQKVCVDHERQIHTIDLVEWCLSLGRRPIKRLLPNQRDILMSKHLHTAARRLAAVRVSDLQRRRLSDLIRNSLAAVETRIRGELGPRIEQVLDEVGLPPRNLPEKVARNKVVQELLDRIVTRGFLTMADVRDGISRNNLKLPDCRGPSQWIHGDQVLRIDNRLTTALDGVYRRGEFYLRWMQHFSSIAFGTALGRLLVLFALLPFGGAYVILAFIQHALEEWIGLEHVELRQWEYLVPLGLFGLGLINVPQFRQVVWRIARLSFQGWRWVLYDVPRYFLRRPWIQRLLHARWLKLVGRFIFKPLVLTAVVWLAPPLRELDLHVSFGMAVATFLAVNLLLNSRLGQNIEEITADWIVQAWRRFGLRLLTSMVALIADISRTILKAIERFLYSVDEWLRFKSGESRTVLATKVVLGSIWFFVTYVIRFVVNLLLEPQINPLKHFPVVTVSHKLLIPLGWPLAELLTHAMIRGEELPTQEIEYYVWLGGLLAGAIILCIPGIFGFLAWELGENWRLYAANRPRDLRPALVGEHGEKMGRLLKRGFHSGTIPKRFSKLRRAERKARLNGRWKPVRKHLLVLHHIERDICRFIEREFLAMLAASDRWRLEGLAVSEVRLGANSVRAAVSAPGSARPLEIGFEARDGWLVAAVFSLGWAAELSPGERQVLAATLLGLFKTAGADLTRQQIEAALPSDCAYDIVERGLLVWPDATFETEALYDLEQQPVLEPRVLSGAEGASLPTLARSRLMFDQIELSWADWVAVWENDIARHGRLGEPFGRLPLLPEPSREG